MLFQSSISDLRAAHLQATEALRQGFAASQDGPALVRGRAAWVDSLMARLWLEFIADFQDGPQGVTLAAIGGYGRQELFPYSDIDLLFLCADEGLEGSHRVVIRRFCQQLWDLGLRVSATTRTLEECERLSADNPEFTLSLLDRRYLAGDPAFFQRLDTQSVPALLSRRRQPLLEHVAALAHKRRARFQNTLFHLEPHLKDGPGGLRDQHTCDWLTLLLPEGARAKEAARENGLRSARREDTSGAYRFLQTVRCFLHYRSQRDDNVLYWQAQDEAAAMGLALEDHGPVPAAQWMRQYFRHARAIDGTVRQLLDEVPSGRTTVLGQLRKWRSRTLLEGHRVENGRLALQGPDEATDPYRVLQLFGLMARHSLQLDRDAEARLAESLPLLAQHLPEGEELWALLRDVLVAPGAAMALRAMHALGILELLLPEFHAMDALVIRDAYHRYTVDEHTFLVIENLHALGEPTDTWEQRMAEVMREVDDPALLYLAALLHDTGKARSHTEHTRHSALVAAAVMDRLRLGAAEQESVLRLIQNHLEMSQALRRDIFDAETVRSFASVVGSPNDLRMLCLLTYADIRSVAPEALTPWKAEDLWRLYIATSNHLDRNVDDDRVHWVADSETLQRLGELSPDDRAAIQHFLDGLPQRYLRTRAPKEVLDHWRMSLRLESAAAAMDVHRAHGWWECTVLTRDRPFLFTDLAGALMAWGMDIVKADAFSNASGLVIDSFRFQDRYRTLELNPGEVDRFHSSVLDVVTKNVAVEQLLAARAHAARTKVTRRRVATHLSFDDASSSHSTVLEVLTQDMPGLLRSITYVIAQLRCNIGVALIDTEADVAIDVFYLTRDGAKLTSQAQQELRAALLAALPGGPAR